MTSVLEDVGRFLPMHAMMPSLMPICRPSGRISLAVTCVDVRVASRYYCMRCIRTHTMMPPVTMRSKSIVASMPSSCRVSGIFCATSPRQCMIGIFLMYSQNPAEKKLSHKMQATTCRLNHDLLDWVSGNDRASSSSATAANIGLAGQHAPRGGQHHQPLRHS
jgi:hypothetical protein